MNNFEDIKDLLDESAQALNRAKLLFNEKDYRWTSQCAQVAIELSVKAVILCFAEFDWTHDPSGQVLKILNENKKKLTEVYGEKVISDIETIAEDAKISAPWHGISIYGEFISPTQRISSLKACTEEKARDLLNRAERTCKIAEEFIKIWFKC